MKDLPTPSLLWGTARSWTPRTPQSLVAPSEENPAEVARRKRLQENAKKNLRRVDLKGQRFGHLTVRVRDEVRQRGYWLCDCDCGTKDVPRTSDGLHKSANACCGYDCPFWGKP